MRILKLTKETQNNILENLLKRSPTLTRRAHKRRAASMTLSRMSGKNVMRRFLSTH